VVRPNLRPIDEANRLCPQRCNAEAGIDFRNFLVGRVRDLVDDRALRGIIAMAMAREMPEGADHCLDRGCLALQFGDVFEREGLDVSAGSGAVAPECQQGLHLFDRKAEVAGPADEAQGVDVVVGVGPVAGLGAVRGRDQLDLLVLADHRRRDVG
jgi:hypothetical protein